MSSYRFMVELWVVLARVAKFSELADVIYQLRNRRLILVDTRYGTARCSSI